MKNVMFQSAIALATVIAGTLGSISEAQATSFYLGNGLSLPKVQNSFSYTQDGIGLTATGLLEDGSSRNVYRSTLGLGVTPNLSWSNRDNFQIDGAGIDESLVLTFNQTVNLLSVTFSRVGANDDFKLIVDGENFIAADIPGGNILDRKIGKFVFGSVPTGNVFGFTVKDNNDDYLVKSVEVSAVPEPLTILGVGTALGFASFFKRELSKKQNNNKA